ncbi:hypothetical protein AB0P15_17680 [Streptomyces sp. NPDC087917]|uniref:hypothetical protein n=1 Tax=Streptomyces sp. NPDC087917 TaxID=3155060 RepID=UPI003425FBF3
MRKALTISAIALASSMALGGATTAFAADSTASPSPSASASASSTPKPAHAALSVPTSPVKPGDSVTLSMEVPDGSTNLSVSSSALKNVKMTDGRGVSATIADVKDGDYGVSLVGTGPEGQKLQATAQLHVKADSPKPTPAPSTVQLSTDFGRAGDKVVVTVKTSAKDASVKSLAFAGGQVNLKSDGEGAFTGTATVAQDVKSGYYGVDAYAGGKKFDTVKFSTEGKSTPDKKTHVNPHVNPDVKPLKPSDHKTPRGSVNTGQAPVGYVAESTRG